MLISIDMDGKKCAFDPAKIRSIEVQFKDTASKKTKQINCTLRGGEEYTFGLTSNTSALLGLEGSEKEAAQKLMDWAVNHQNSEIARLYIFLFDAANGKISDPCFVYKAVKF